MITLVIVYTPIAYVCLPLSYCIPCIPLYVLFTHVHTLVILYTLYALVYPLYILFHGLKVGYLFMSV